MRDIEKISEKLDKRKNELSELFAKDDENYELWAGKEQKFDDHKMAINLTGTEMISLALRVQASMLRSSLQVQVLPPDKNANPNAHDEANQEERMYYHGLAMADDRLYSLGEPGLLASMAWQATVPGRIAVRVLVYKDKDEVIWDFLPLYPRFLLFNFDSKGLSWASYETFRSAESIYDEYKIEVEDDGKGVSVSDYWDRDHNVRFITKERKVLGKVWKHPFKEVPIIFQPVARSPKAIDPVGVQVSAWGESIFDCVKIPFRNLNKLRSIAATHAHLLAKAPLDVTYEGDDPNIEADQLEYYPGSMVKHPNTVKIESMKVADIPPSLGMMMDDLKMGIQHATFAELNPNDPGHSGSALRILGQDKQDTLTPRVGAINTAYTRLCRLVKRQILGQKLTVSVKTVVNDSYHVFDMTPQLLENDFYVTVNLIKHDVYDEVEALQRAQMLLSNRLMARADIMERVLKEQDVQTQIMKMDEEDIEAAIPEIKLKRLIKSYIDRGMIEEAHMAEEQLALLEIQKLQSMGMPEGGPGEQDRGNEGAVSQPVPPGF